MVEIGRNGAGGRCGLSRGAGGRFRVEAVLGAHLALEGCGEGCDPCGDGDSGEDGEHCAYPNTPGDAAPRAYKQRSAFIKGATASALKYSQSWSDHLDAQKHISSDICPCRVFLWMKTASSFHCSPSQSRPVRLAAEISCAHPAIEHYSPLDQRRNSHRLTTTIWPTWPSQHFHFEQYLMTSIGKHLHQQAMRMSFGHEPQSHAYYLCRC
jgi:hypothetical protein